MEMTDDRWRYTETYLEDVFGEQDAHLAGLMDKAVEAGLPDIAVSASVGRLLKLLTGMTAGRLAIEVGTLGGYSGIWIARGLRSDGRLVTLELDDRHADFAQRQFNLAGVSPRVELRRGAAIDVLAQLRETMQPGSVDVVFIDAVKEEYPAYWELVRPLIAVGGLIIADNVLGSGSWWIDDEPNAARQAVDRLNRLVAQDGAFEAVALPLRQGLLVGRRVQ